MVMVPPGFFDVDEQFAAPSAVGEPRGRLSAAVDFRVAPAAQAPSTVHVGDVRWAFGTHLEDLLALAAGTVLVADARFPRRRNC